MAQDTLAAFREFLKDTLRKRVDFSRTDQNRGVPPPPVEQTYPPDAPRVDLPAPGAWSGIGSPGIAEVIGRRQSRRIYLPDPLSLDELAFLLWATQGVRAHGPGGAVFRTVPSAGCRHAIETRIAALHVEGLQAGIYRYLPTTHQLLFEFSEKDLGAKLAAATFGQPYAGNGAATFLWSAVPYRMEWRYGLASHKVIALDAGHVCQNLYLACEAIGAGTVAIAAYDQEAMDALLRLDGQEEFVIYLAPVGKITPVTPPT